MRLVGDEAGVERRRQRRHHLVELAVHPDLIDLGSSPTTDSIWRERVEQRELGVEVDRGSRPQPRRQLDQELGELGRPLELRDQPRPLQVLTGSDRPQRLAQRPLAGAAEQLLIEILELGERSQIPGLGSAGLGLDDLHPPGFADLDVGHAARRQLLLERATLVGLHPQQVEERHDSRSPRSRSKVTPATWAR